MGKVTDLYNSVFKFADNSTPANPGSIALCLLCYKPFVMRFFTGEPDQICSECWESYKDCAKLICNRCKVTIARVIPKVLDNGYYIRPKSILHIDACNICKPGLLISDVIEIKKWENEVRPKKIIMVGR